MRIDELPIPDEVKKVFLNEGICELYPPQEDAFRKTKVLEDGNLLMTSPTASGKTLVAEICALKHIIERGGKVLYVTPLRALASEKYDRFKRYEVFKKLDGKRVRVAMSTGDYDSNDPWLARYDVIVTTYEKFDSLLRHGAPWIADLTLLVVDEVHYLGQGDRGPTLEVVLTRFRQVNPKGQILALSATVRNVEEIAEWLNAEYTATDWRPVKLREGVYLNGAVRFNDGTVLNLESRGKPVEDIAYDTIRGGGQILVFANTRKRAVKLAKKLSKTVKNLLSKRNRKSLKVVSNSIMAGESRTRLDETLAKLVENGVAFHHAGLTHNTRSLIEEAFRKGHIKALAATPTLAAGVNLPARRVVLASYKRYEPGYGRYPISVMEYKQMCLPYDAEILLADGTYAKIGEIVEKREEVKLTTLDEKSHRLQSNSLLEKFSRYAREFIELEVQHGEKIKVTPDHPILTPKGWREARSITVGDEIAHITEIPYLPKMPKPEEILPNNTYVVDTEGLFSKWLRKLMAERRVKKKDLAKMLNVNYRTFLNWTNSSRRRAIPMNLFINVAKLAGCSNAAKHIKLLKTTHGKPLNFRNLLTGDFIWLSGLIAASGYLNQRKGTISVRVLNEDELIIHKACDVLKMLGLKYRQSQRGHAWVVECSSMLLGFILRGFGIPIGKKSGKLRISETVKSLPKPLLAQYLGGVFDGSGEYVESTAESTIRLIRIHGKSEGFVRDLKEALLKLGVVSRICSEPIDRVKELGGVKARLKYNVTVSSTTDINGFFNQIHPVKEASHNSISFCEIHSEDICQRNRHITWSKVVGRKSIVCERPIPVYNVAVAGDNNYICNNLVLHNCGRAGRPGYDPVGEAILIARSEDEAEFLMERYVYSRPERIWSNLGAEPYLRPHVLSAIATGVAQSGRGVLEFFSKTLYARQMGFGSIVKPVNGIMKFLEENGFIKVRGDLVEATRLGKRVSELYIDPMTAAIMVNGFKNREAEEVTDFSILHLASHTPDASPKLYPRRVDIGMLERALELHEDEILIELPDRFSEPVEFEFLLGEVKMALVLLDWIDEVSDNTILERYDVEPGDLHRLVSSVNWLLYAAQELSKLMKLKNLSSRIGILRERVEKGVKEELLTLASLEGVGRIRARALYQAGYKTLEDLRKASLEELMRVPTIGGRVAKSIKEQVGGVVLRKVLKAAEEAGFQKALTDYSRRRQS